MDLRGPVQVAALRLRTQRWQKSCALSTSLVALCCWGYHSGYIQSLQSLQSSKPFLLFPSLFLSLKPPRESKFSVSTTGRPFGVGIAIRRRTAKVANDSKVIFKWPRVFAGCGTSRFSQFFLSFPFLSFVILDLTSVPGGRAPSESGPALAAPAPRAVLSSSEPFRGKGSPTGSSSCTRAATPLPPTSGWGSGSYPYILNGSVNKKNITVKQDRIHI